MGCSSTKEVNKNVHFEEKNSPLSSRVNTLGNSTPQKSSSKKKNYSKLGALRFNSRSYVNTRVPKLNNETDEDSKSNLSKGNKENHLMHLVSALNRGALIEEKDNYDKIREYINWTLTKKSNGEKLWINKGKIILSKSEFEKIIQIPFDKIKNESFLNRRIWVNNYIQNVISDQIVDNPVIVISRDNILDDAFNQFKTNKDINLKRPIHVHFIDEKENDVGGVYREFFSCIFKEFFSSKRKFFKENNYQGLGRNTIIINHDCENTSLNLEYYEFFGKLIAKALIDRINLNENLNHILLKQLMHLPIILEDLKYFDIDIYHSFIQILNAKNIEPSDNLTFSWSIKIPNTNKYINVDLIPNGSKTKITNENRKFFIEKAIEYISYKFQKEKIDSIVKGFNSLIPEDKLTIFNVDEFDLLLSGQVKIDISDWKNNTEYIEYKENDDIIKWFWEILNKLRPEQVNSFFTFCTGMIKPPLNGFRVLQSSRNQIVKFCIEKNQSDSNLIQAKTCFNKILLPFYKSYEKLKENILIIVNNDTNFFGLD